MEVGKIMNLRIEGKYLVFDNDSWIKKVKYNRSTKQMLVNGKYECQNVPLKIFVDFALSDSKGKYWNLNIKGKEEFQHYYFKKSGEE